MSAALQLSDLVHLVPLLWVAGWGCLTLLIDALGQSRSARLWPLALLGLAVGLGLTVGSFAQHATPAVGLLGGVIHVDRFALFLDGLFLVAGMLTLLLAGPFLAEHRFAHGEHHSLLLLTIAGMMLLVHAADLVVLVIGLETMSVGLYALAASWLGNRKSAEAGLKYFLMGAVASAFLLYGIALCYGATGETRLDRLALRAAHLAESPMFLLGMYMVLAAMAFKVALVPFHAWAPDVYEGAPTTVSGFMATAVKAAGFGALLRVFGTAFADERLVYGRQGWGSVLWTVAIATMVIGNITALRQVNVKRMLAFSSVSHAGYLLLGVIAAGGLPAESRPAVLYYLLAYAVTTIGAFGVVSWVGSRNDERVSMDEWGGLASKHPVAAAAMTLFLLSLAGIPPTAGFFAKLYLFRAALADPQLLTLVIIGALNSVVAVYYYLKPVVAMYFRPETRPASPLRSGATATALALAAALVLLLGLLPGHALEWAAQAIMAAP